VIDSRISGYSEISMGSLHKLFVKHIFRTRASENDTE